MCIRDRISISKPVQLAVSHGRSLASEIEHAFAFGAAQFFDGYGRRLKLGGQRNIGAANQRGVVIEKLAATGQAPVRAREAWRAQVPANGNFGLGKQPVSYTH